MKRLLWIFILGIQPAWSQQTTAVIRQIQTQALVSNNLRAPQEAIIKESQLFVTEVQAWNLNGLSYQAAYVYRRPHLVAKSKLQWIVRGHRLFVSLSRSTLSGLGFAVDIKPQ